MRDSDRRLIEDFLPIQAISVEMSREQLGGYGNDLNADSSTSIYYCSGD